MSIGDIVRLSFGSEDPLQWELFDTALGSIARELAAMKGRPFVVDPHPTAGEPPGDTLTPRRIWASVDGYIHHAKQRGLSDARALELRAFVAREFSCSFGSERVTLGELGERMRPRQVDGPLSG